MDLIQAAEVRISRRSFLDTPIEGQLLSSIEEKISIINKTSGLTCTWVANGASAFSGGKSYGFFRGVKGLLVLKGDKTLPFLKELVGYYGEWLVLELTAMGLGTCWVGGTFSKAALSTPEQEEVVCVIPVGYVSKEKTFKESLIHSFVHRKTKTIEQLLQSDIAVYGQLLRAMELVQKAPTARNTQKVFFTAQNGIITASVPDDYPFDLVDLGICKLHFELGYGGQFRLGNGAPLDVQKKPHGLEQ